MYTIKEVTVIAILLSTFSTCSILLAKLSVLFALSDGAYLEFVMPVLRSQSAGKNDE